MMINRRSKNKQSKVIFHNGDCYYATFSPDTCSPDTSCIHLYPFVYSRLQYMNPVSTTKLSSRRHPLVSTYNCISGYKLLLRGTSRPLHVGPLWCKRGFTHRLLFQESKVIKGQFKKSTLALTFSMARRASDMLVELSIWQYQRTTDTNRFKSLLKSNLFYLAF